MSASLAGIPGIGEIYPGGHLCAIFTGVVEREKLLVSFMQEGLREGDRCVCFVDELDPARMQRLAYAPVSPGDTRRSGHLSVRSAPQAYLQWGGSSARATISHLVGPGPAGGARPLLRAAGQMPLAGQEGEGQEDEDQALCGYESAVVVILGVLPSVFLCLYDTQRFGAGMLAGMLKSHSRILIDGAVLYNAGAVGGPRDRDGGAPGAGHGGRGGTEGWASLSGAEVRIAELVGRGLTNRATADELIVSPHTVDAHLKHIYQKLGIHSRAELAVLTFRHRSPGA